MENLLDLHSHSSFSPDAKDGAELMCERAKELGLFAYALTDHCDCNFWLPADEWERENARALTVDREMYGVRDYARASIKTVSALKEKYPFLLCGIELGQPLQNPAAAAEICAMRELDLIIGSHHMNAGRDDFYWLDYGSMDIGEIYALMSDYFTQICEMCTRADFDVLGHLTYPLRYITGECGIELDMSRFYEQIREIFRRLIGRGKGIEINTSGLRQRYGRLLPDREYVKMYRECGGEILTLGSDAHCAADIAKGIDEGAELARECGFKYTAYFERREARFMSL